MDDNEFIEKTINEVASEKEFLYSELEKINVDVHNTDTNFLLINLGKWCDRNYERLKQKGVLVRNLNKHPLLNGYLRVTIGKRQDNLKFLNSLYNLQDTTSYD